MVTRISGLAIASIMLVLQGCSSNDNTWIVGSNSILSQSDKSDYVDGKAVLSEFVKAWIYEDYNKVYAMIHPKCRYNDDAQRQAWEKIEKFWRKYGVVYVMYRNSKDLSAVKFGSHMSNRDRTMVRSMDDFRERITSILDSMQLIKKDYRRENVIEMLYIVTNGNNLFDREINQRLWPDRVMFISYQLSSRGTPSFMVLIKDKGKWYPVGTPGNIDVLFDESYNIDMRPSKIAK